MVCHMAHQPLPADDDAISCCQNASEVEQALACLYLGQHTTVLQPQGVQEVTGLTHILTV